MTFLAVFSHETDEFEFNHYKVEVKSIISDSKYNVVRLFVKLITCPFLILVLL
jgi:hypothetical protein